MIGKPIALIQIPNQRGFRPRAAAKYCGIDEDTLAKHVKAGFLNGRRLYLLEDLDLFLETLPRDNSDRSQPVPASSERKDDVRR